MPAAAGRERRETGSGEERGTQRGAWAEGDHGQECIIGTDPPVVPPQQLKREEEEWKPVAL